MHSQNLKKTIAKKFVESASIIFTMLFMFAGIVYAAYTTWSPGQPQGSPAEGNVRPPVIYDDGGRINNVSAPISDSDAVNKGYVDALTTLAAGGEGGSLFVAYGSTSCPTGFVKAYDGVVVNIQPGVLQDAAASPVSNHNIICAGDERLAYPADHSARPVWGQHHSSYIYLPLTNYAIHLNMMKCAVCVR